MVRTKILIVEDESLVALDIKISLEDLNYDVTDILSSKEEVLKSIKNNTPDIVLMDINLNEKEDGISIAKDIKKISRASIIFLTSYSDDLTIKRAIEVNPSSYLIKPFKLEDLKASILLCSHNKEDKKQTINLQNDYIYDLVNKKIFYKNDYIKLSKNEEKLLFLLVIGKGNVVLYSKIEDELWQNDSIHNDTLRALIYRLRSKLKDLDIQTVASLGYKLSFA